MTRETLHDVSKELIAWLRERSDEEVRTLLANMKEYHGFPKTRLPEDVISSLLKAHRLLPKKMQIELVRVPTDLSHKAHKHMRARAFISILGRKEHLSELKSEEGFAYIGLWLKVKSGDMFDVLPGTVHTFAAKLGMGFEFLSVQTPPIENGVNDDFELVPIDRCPFL